MSGSAPAPAGPAGLAATFAALGDPRRLALVERLYRGDGLSVSVLCEGMDVSRQAVSKHLRTLADARIISSEKSGRETLYSLERPRLVEANAFLALVGDKWEEAFDRLKLHLAESAAGEPVTGEAAGGGPRQGVRPPGSGIAKSRKRNREA